MDLVLLLAQPAEGASPWVTFLPLIIIVVIFYFLIIRPQKKQEQERQDMIAAIEKGDKIVTIGGVHGTVRQVDDDSLLVEVDSNVKLRVDKNAVANVGNK